MADPASPGPRCHSSYTKPNRLRYGPGPCARMTWTGLVRAGGTQAEQERGAWGRLRRTGTEGEWMYGSNSGRGLRMTACAAATGAALLVAGCSSDGEDKGEKNPATSQQPKAIDPYWVNPDGNAAKQVETYTKDGDDKNAELIKKIASQPVGEWIGPDNPEEEARGFTEAAAKADRDALLVLYNVPHRDCGQFSKGGASDGNAYREWVDKVAKGIGDRRATVVLEPDALLHLVDGCTPQEFHEERFDLLKGAVERLKQQPPPRSTWTRATPAGSRPTRSSSRSSGRASTRRTASRSTSPTSSRPT